MSKYIVCHGEDVIELHRNQLSKVDAKHIAQGLVTSGYKNVRIRKEDPNHPTWPLNFDLEEAV